MKANYEDRTRMYLTRRTNTIFRIDGKAFHTFTRKLKKPFDDGLIWDMTYAATRLCEEIQGAKIGYVQSDEISILATDYDTLATHAWFDGNVMKMTSVAASIATASFNHSRSVNERQDQNPAMFDARVFTIPEKEEVANYFLWRSQDAARNSVQMFARAHFSHKQLEGKGIPEIHEMLHQKGENWAHLDAVKKQGTLIIRGVLSGDWDAVAVHEPFTHDLWKQYVDRVTTFTTE